MSAPTIPATTGLLLAAGEGRRFGLPKGLAVTGGVPWVLRSAIVLLEGGCADVVVVTGAQGGEVEKLVADRGDERVETVRCGTWAEGMGESLRAGLTALATRGRRMPQQALVHLVDLPDVGADVVERVLAAGQEHGKAAGNRSSALLRATYLGVPGHPVLIGQDHWSGVLRQARGDAGARSYLRQARPTLVECGDLATGADVDVDPEA